MITRPTMLILRGGPGDGVELVEAVDLTSGAIAQIRRTGFVYRDSGRSFKGRRIFDWLPTTGS